MRSTVVCPSATRAAMTKLAEARRTNPRVPAYLLGRKRIPARLPDAIGFGDESEAVACAADQTDAWNATHGALDWLAKAV